jgi:hypothetical protein
MDVVRTYLLGTHYISQKFPISLVPDLTSVLVRTATIISSIKIRSKHILSAQFSSPDLQFSSHISPETSFPRPEFTDAAENEWVINCGKN